MELVLLVAVLGAVGAVLRWKLTALNNDWPWGTLLANVVASFALGCISGWVGVWAEAAAVGLCGALSTWSTVGREVIVDEAPTAYLPVTVLASLAAAALGLQFSG